MAPSARVVLVVVCLSSVAVYAAMYTEVLFQHIQWKTSTDRGDTMRSEQTKPTTPVVPNVAWLAERKKLLAQNTKAKVFLFTYMRGGSSTVGEIFNQDSAATLWYEPGDAFYMAYYGLHAENFPQHDLYYSNMTRRILEDYEQQWQSDFYTAKFSCNYGNLPSEALSHHFLREVNTFPVYKACMGSQLRLHVQVQGCYNFLKDVCGTTIDTSHGNKCHLMLHIFRNLPSSPEETERYLSSAMDKYQIPEMTRKYVDAFAKHALCTEREKLSTKSCLPLAINKCETTHIQVAEVNRMKMEDMEMLLENNPDLHVVYFVRDPRAIASSRIHTDQLIFNTQDKRVVTEARIVCHKMREDKRHKDILDIKFPGSFLQIRYEDLVRDPEGTAAEIYSVLGRNHSKAWDMYAARTMHGNINEGPFSHLLSNATANAEKWRSSTPASEIKEINSFCADVIESLNYSL